MIPFMLMLKIHHIIFLAREISRSCRHYRAGARPLPACVRRGLANGEIEARGLQIKMVEVDFCDSFGNEFTQLVPEPVNDPLDIYSVTLRRASESAKTALAKAVTTIKTISELIFDIEADRADRLPPPKITDTIKLGVSITLAPRLIPTPIPNRA